MFIEDLFGILALNKTKCQPCSSKVRFSKEEDDIIISKVKVFGKNNWKAVSSFLKDRSSRQVRERYINYLDPESNTGPWTEEEDLLLISKVDEIGPKWSQIRPFFKKRTDVIIRNRWIHLRNAKKSSWHRERVARISDDTGKEKKIDLKPIKVDVEIETPGVDELIPQTEYSAPDDVLDELFQEHFTEENIEEILEAPYNFNDCKE